MSVDTLRAFCQEIYEEKLSNFEEFRTKKEMNELSVDLNPTESQEEKPITLTNSNTYLWNE